MADILTIYNSIKFIEENLQEPVTVMDIASNAGYSLFHFSRTFNSVTGHNPYDYLIRRRLSEAAKIITENSDQLTSIAFEFQFNNLETFSRAFKRLFGITPVRYRTEQLVCATPLKTIPSLDYLQHLNNNDFFRPALKYIGKIYLIGNMADLCPNSPRLQPLDSQSCILAFAPDKQKENRNCFLFRQVSSLESVPDNAVTKTIPALKYVQFTHLSGDIRYTYEYIFQTWLPLSEFSLCMPYSVELLSQHVSEDAACIPPLAILIPIQKL